MRKWIIVFLVIVAGVLLSSEWWWPHICERLTSNNPTCFSDGEIVASLRSEFPTKEVVQILITAVLLGAAIYVILAKRYGPKDKHWAYGIVGTIIGFWFK